MRAASLMAQEKYPEALFEFQRAEAVFPLSFYIRESRAAMFNGAQMLPVEIVLAAIDKALDDDPYNGVLLLYRTAALARLRDFDGAEAALRRLKEVGTNWPQTANAERLLKAVRRKVTRDE